MLFSLRRDDAARAEAGQTIVPNSFPMTAVRPAARSHRHAAALHRAAARAFFIRAHRRTQRFTIEAFLPRRASKAGVEEAPTPTAGCDPPRPAGLGAIGVPPGLSP